MAISLERQGQIGPPPSRLAHLALAMFVWLLPIHMLAMAMLFGLWHVDENIVRSIAAWKEITVLALVGLTIGRAAVGLGSNSRVGWEDLAVGSLIGLALLFLITENIWFRANIPVGAELYGLRDLIFFMLLYFVGRSTADVVRKESVLRALYWVAVLTSIVAVFERIFVTPEMLVLLGAASYFQQFLGEAAFTAGNEFGLPQAFWTQIGGVYVRRAGSVYMVSQAFAISFLLLMPAATLWVWGRVKRPSALTIAGFVVIWVGLLLSLTRMTIIACAIQVLIYALMRRKAISAVSALAVSALLIVAVSSIFPQLLGFFWQTITWQTASSESHLDAWWNGVVVFLQRPWGSGLGTTDASAVRFGMTPLTGDNQFLKYAVELGLPGLLLHLAVFAAIAHGGWRVFRHSESATERSFGAVILLTTLGILVNAWTATVFNSTILAYLYFWLGGAVVSVSHRDRLSLA